MKITKKIGISLCIAALLMTASGCGGQSGSAPSEASNASSDTQSSVTSESQESKNDESSAEESSKEAESSVEESSEIPPERILGWTFREVKDPEVKDPEYVKHDDYTRWDADEFRTVKTEQIFDFEKTAEMLKKDPAFAGLEFYNYENETQYFYEDEADNVIITPTKQWQFVGVNKSLDDLKQNLDKESVYYSYFEGMELKLVVKRQYSKYDVPNYYDLSIVSDKMSQDDMFDITKKVFGEPIAEFLIYQQAEDNKYNDESSNSMYKRIDTPDGKGHYYFDRSVSKYGGKTSLHVYVEFSSGYDDYIYVNDFKPMTWSVSPADMFEFDVGGKDYTKPDFFNKALSFGEKYDPYEKSTVEREEYAQIDLSDGTKYISYYVEGHKLSNTKPDTKETREATWGQRSTSERCFKLRANLRKNTDNTIKVTRAEVTLPTLVKYQKDVDKELVAECQSMAIKQITDILKLSSNVFDDGYEFGDDNTGDSLHQDYSKTKVKSGVGLTLFGCKVSAEIHAGARMDVAWFNTDNQDCTYYSNMSFEMK